MSSESLFAALLRRAPLLMLFHPRQHTMPLALAVALGLTLGAAGTLLFGLPLWAAAALVLVLLALPLALKWRADRQRWGDPLALLGVLLAVQGLRVVEHLAQWVQYHLLGWPLAKAGGLLAPLNPEVVQFVWAWAVLLLVIGMLRTRGRNVWMWLLLGWSALQAAELTYTFARYLQTGVQQMPGILGRGGWLATQADSLAQAAWLAQTLPQLVATPRLDVQFWWSIGALLLLLPAAHTAARRLLSSDTPVSQPGRRPILSALKARAGIPLALLRRANRRVSRAGLATVAVGLAVVFGSLFQSLTPAFAAPGTVTGTVFNDFNGSGTRDVATNNETGVAGVTVTAYDATGTPVATATTAANGTYTLNVPVAGIPLRIEFTNLPAGYQPGPIGTDSGTKVQFVTATAANVSLGVLIPSEYCQNNPQLATQCYYFAPQNSVNVLKVFPYTSGTTANDDNTGIDTTPAPNQQLVSANTVGATWGLAYARTARQFYMASFMKRHLAFGANGPGVIYRVDRNTGTTTEFINLNTVFASNPAGIDLHTAANSTANAGEAPYFEDYTAWDAVGKVAFAGLDLSEDEQSLWTVTLSNSDRQLYRIPVNSPTAANIQRFALPDPGTGATGCPLHPATLAGELNRNLRPGAVVVRGTKVYVSLTCTAESTQQRSDLRAFVYAFDTVAATFSQVANFPLTYQRGAATTNGPQNINLAIWEPWATAPNPAFPFGFGTATIIPKYFSTFQQHYYPQPWLTDLAFDETGSMIVGLTDRFGHQSGNRNGNSDSGPIEGVSAGDILRLAPSGATWTLESNASSGGTSTGGAGNIQGPGGGEYYYQDSYTARGTEANQPTHNEVTLGGLAVWLGSNQVVSSAFDPPPTATNINQPGVGSTPPYRTGGLIWLNNTGAQAGQRARSYLLYYSDQALNPQQPGLRNGTLGKAAGIGDVELLCDAAPIELGNRVWEDADRDGVQDPGEIPLSGVTVQLVDSTNTVIATAVTDANGNYRFSSATGTSTASARYGLTINLNSNYEIRIPSLNGIGYTLTTPNADASANGDERDSDGVTVGANSVIALTTGGPGTTNHSYDFGFYRPFSLGNRVWNDLNNDGLDNDGAGTGIDGVTVNLYLDTNGSGTLDAGDTPAGTTTTANGGYYLFTGLLAGNYLVQLPSSNFGAGGQLQNFISSTGTQGNASGPYEAAPDPDNNIDQDDNGTTNSGGLTGFGLAGGIVSLPVTLGPTASEPTGEGATPGIIDPTLDNQSNLTLDFGVFRPLSLGNQVWNDANNNGVIDGGENGIDNVRVELRDAGTGTLIAFTNTNAQGYYLFTNLGAGSYVVVLPASNFGSGPLAGYTSSTGTNGSLTGPYEPGNSGPADNNDNGSLSAGAITSAPITLAPGTAPIGEPATPGITDPALDANSNLTVDFGLFQPLSLGNRIWNDLNNDGLDNDGAGTGIGNVAVNLLDAGGVVIATANTNPQGYYLFTNLLPGTYTVELASSNFTGTGALVGFTSSTGKWGNIPPFPYEPGVGVPADGNDNGTVSGTLGAGGSIRSDPVTLALGTAPLGEPATPGITNPATDANSDLTIDFGVYRPASLGDFIWNDLDRDGIQDAGEPGIPGVTVSLYDSTGTILIARVTTDANGNYTFGNLQPGTSYVIRLDNPADYGSGGPLNGFRPTRDNQGANDAVDSDATLANNGAPIGAGNYPTIGTATTGAAGSNTPTFDIGFYQPLSLGNRVWNDLNNNGLDDDGVGTGIGNVTVNLLDAGGAVIATTTTNAQGYYLFNDLAAGTYTVELPAANFGPTAPLEGFISSTGKWGNIPPFPYEPGAGGSTDADDNGTLAGGAIRSGPITLALGTAPSGEPVTPGLADLAADANSNQTIDFGVVRPASIGDFIWNDLDRDGVQDAGEPGIPGVTVNLYDGSGNLIASVITDANGNYTFPNLQPGTSYVIRLDNPADYDPGRPLNGFRLTQDNQGANDAVDSDATLANNGAPIGAGNYPTIGTATTGAAGSNTPTFDIGFFQPLSLGNRVWNDLNNNGLDDDGPTTGIANVRVNLLDAGGNVVAFTNTNAQGYYLFTNLAAGTYTVELDATNFAPTALLEGYTSSTGTNGSTSGPFEPGASTPVDGNDNGTVTGVLGTPTGSIRSGPITLAAGTAPTGEPATPGITDPAADNNSNLTIDFGLFQPLSLGNQVWNDLNNNGLIDGGETGIAGVTVELRDAGTGTLIATTVTNGQGYYLFTNLGAGSYVVVLPATNFSGLLAGYTSSTGANGSLTGPYEPGNSGPADNNDNGSFSAGAIASAPITLAPGTAPTGEPATPGLPDPALDSNSDRTIDFGLFQPLSLGNRVWNDLNNNGLDDDGAGTGITSVQVNLLDAGGALVAQTTTNAQGYYLFTNLAAGTYTVELPAANFGPTAPLEGFTSSTGKWGNIPPFPYEPGVGTPADGNDNGTVSGTLGAGGSIRSGAITLAAGTAPLGEPATPGITNPATDANSDLTIDFGVVRPASLGDFIWNDLDRDGVQDAGEPGIPGVTVNLYDGSGNLIASVITDANGNYTFGNLQPGTSYVIRLDNPADYDPGRPLNGFRLTQDNQGANDATDSDATLANNGAPIGAGNYPTIGTATTGAAGSNTPTFDIGFFQPLSLGNRVWNDLNNDGLDNDGAGTGIGNVTVNLLDAGGAVIATTNTNAQGYYLFTNLLPGTYTVELDASNFVSGGLVGFTSSTGKWGNIPPFPYEPGAGAPADGNDNGTVSGTLGAGGSIRSNPVTLALGTAPLGEPATPGITDPALDANSDLTIDFGVVRPASIGDFIWNDLDRDGVQDAGEPGLPGVTVNLYDGSGNLIASVITDANGNYTFPNLQPGTSYVIRLDNPADYSPGGPLDGFRPTQDNQGANDATDSDATLANNGAPIGTGNYPTIGTATTGAAGSNTPTFDIGFFQPLSLGNRVWNDLNNDGLDNDGASTGIANVRVNLLDAGGTVVAFTNTDAQGYYLFTNLLPGTYLVALPASNFTGAGALVGFASSTGTAGSATGPYEPGDGSATDNNDNGSANAGAVTSAPITLGVGTAPTGEPATPGLADFASDTNSNQTIDFGVFQPLSLGNQVWRDLNNNGVVDGGETGIPGVTVNLLDANGNLIATTTTNAQGYFLFTNLGAGSYVVELPASNFTGPLAGYTSSTGANGTLTGPYEPGNSGANDNNDNGSLSGGAVRSDVIVLTPGGSPTGEAAVPGLPDPASDANSNQTIDFGLFQPLSLGNQVWNDLNNNGLLDAGESGIANVAMQLLDVGGTVIATTTTNAQGYYLFTNLQPGTYSVRIAPSNFATGAPLQDYISSTGNGTGTGATNPGPYEPGTGGAGDGNDNGSGTVNLATTGIASSPITLALGGSPTGEPATPGLADPALDTNSDLTIDFGVFRNPTAIGLVSFTATRDGSGVKLSWTTSVEIDTAGFYLYRSADRDRANAVRITPSLLAARGNGNGATYSWTDTAPLETGFYWLQEVELEGATQDYGPVTLPQTGGSRILLPIIRR